MGSNIGESLGEVMTTGNDAVLAHHDSSHGNLTLVKRLTCLVECPLHIELVFLLLFFGLRHSILICLQKYTFFSKKSNDAWRREKKSVPLTPTK